jgi:5-methylcytosine-specific restriction endonuclease McrA
MSWTHQPHRTAKPAPAAIEKHARKAERETAYKIGSTGARRRDGGRCRLCGDHRNLETHHVRPRSVVGKTLRDRLENLLTLCASCHKEVTEHIIKLYPGPDGANGLIRVERYSKPHKDWLEVRREA